MHIFRKQNGFTIIELLVVVAVIAILATVIVVSYGGWRTSINTSVVKSDLTAAATAMENGRNRTPATPHPSPQALLQAKTPLLR